MSLVVRILTPTGRDAELITEVLTRHDVPARPAAASALLGELWLGKPLGPLLIAGEALTAELLEWLAVFVREQPAWSDLPILVLTSAGSNPVQSGQSEAAWQALGSPVLLERPLRTASLVSSVRAALRARVRQYEIRDALASLKEEQETLRAVLNNLPVGVVVAKPSGEVVLGNRRVEEIFRHPILPTPDMDAHQNWGVRHPDGRRLRSEEFPLVRTIAQAQALPTEEYIYDRGDGTSAWVGLTAAPILSEEGKVTGGVVVVSDIDQGKRSEAALIQSEKLAAVGRLAASISHEINNPLEAVTNLLYLARQSEGVPETVCAYLATADAELSRVSQIVSHTLRFHRQSTRPRAVSARELLESTLGLYSGRLANSFIQLEVRHRGRSAVVCYEGEIRQTLNNLVGNAIEAMRTGGRLLIRSHDSHCWKSGEPGIRITVADTGCGMPPEVQSRIFEAFYTTKGINGTGLGLWISHGIIAKHHGSLRLRSSVVPGASGTVFEIFLPCEPFQRTQESAPNALLPDAELPDAVATGAVLSGSN